MAICHTILLLNNQRFQFVSPLVLVDFLSDSRVDFKIFYLSLKGGKKLFVITTSFLWYCMYIQNLIETLNVTKCEPFGIP